MLLTVTCLLTLTFSGNDGDMSHRLARRTEVYKREFAFATISGFCMAPVQNTVSAQEDYVFSHSMRHGQRGGVYRYGIEGRALTLIRSLDHVEIHGLFPNRTSTRVAVVASQYRRGEVFESNTKITVIDAQGAALCQIDRAGYAVAWSPDGSKLAYTTGHYVPDAGFAPEGVRIFDMEKQTSRKLNNGDYGGAVRLHWARFDGKLYVDIGDEVERVVTYDPESDAHEDSLYEGTGFSPDEGHYFTYDLADGRVRLFRRRDHRDITERYGYIQGDHLRSDRPAWVSSDVLAFGSIRLSCHLLDLRSRIAVEVTEPVITVRDGLVYVWRSGPSVGVIAMDSLRVVYSPEQGAEVTAQ